MPDTAVSFDVEPVNPALGGIIRGVDLREPLDAAMVDAIRQAVLTYGIVFLRDQDMTRDQMADFMACFGDTISDPFTGYDQPIPPRDAVTDMPTLAYSRATAVWHIDSSLAPAPASLMALRAIQLPSAGGDTCFANMYAVYESLSEPMRTMLDGLTAVHSASKVLPLMAGANTSVLQEDMRNVHPCVRVHPETGRKALFVDELWTEAIVELEPGESAALLAYLRQHTKSPNFTLRWRWQQDDVALWDNRCLQHYAVRDYTETRVMQKVLLAGDRPYGPR